MNSKDFDTIYFDLTTPILTKAGFKRIGRNWFYKSNDFQLALFMIINKGSQLTSSRYFTLALSHNGILNIDNQITADYEKDPVLYPVCIAPSKISNYVKSNFDSKYWKYSPCLVDMDNEYTSDQIFYGDYNNEVGSILKTLGWIKKKNVKMDNEINNLAENVSNYGLKWAEYMRPNNLLIEFNRTKNDYPVTDKWIDCYNDYCKKNNAT